MKRRHLISLALCSTLLAACSDKPADATATGFSGIDITGADYATGFSLTDHNGQARTLADFKGKVVVVNFWASWCKPCEQEAAEMEEGEEQARYYHFTVVQAMAALRSPVDKLEMIVDKEAWPMPSYGDLMFEV